MLRTLLLPIYLLTSSITLVSSFQPTTTTITPIQQSYTSLSAQTNDNVDRSAFLKHVKATCFASTVGLGLITTGPMPSWAKDDPNVKGTKGDPKYQACVSACVYECTKPKGDEQKSRAECIPECKQKCATSKEQLMMGTPKKD